MDAKREVVALRAEVAAKVEDRDVIRRELALAAVETDVRQRAALPAAYLCDGIIVSATCESGKRTIRRSMKVCSPLYRCDCDKCRWIAGEYHGDVEREAWEWR